VPGINIDWKAHLGGLVIGVCLGAAFAYAPQVRRNAVHIGVCAVVAAVILADVLARTAVLNG
jgi:membrane associated rhomboid family serine protease